MAEHYYSKTPDAKENRQQHQTTLRGFSFRFWTDNGVFSKGGIDYGSRFLIEQMQIGEADRVLDVGCGYGPIGLTAARLAPKGQAVLLDINERAVELARENARSNEIANVDIRQSDLYEAAAGLEKFDVILTNPPIRAGKAVVHRIFEEGAELLKPGGSMWVVIQKKQGAPSAEAKLQQLFGKVVEIGKDKGFRIFKAIKG
ncbi:class I SAM-dependent methyltransferase [Paenibacillus pasadenensis]|uniref:Ribosomal RNA small subunit methyltransferase C n=1 Tax=Paenibacillus pasadenensis TaxID=217090 RepID=A0A2N5N1C6_9BACL|nr:MULTISPECIES: class I SAM-dependent methyltransferase [Paenibacillus]PLT44141.1 Ribosomal RNA small subunit methyltransferase C [Paenibacillus pasadenensis]QGG54670.1 methyltransferase [Paenibacillus sp. B01]